MKLLEAQRKLRTVYDDGQQRRTTLQAKLRRLQEMYEWGHKTKEQYLVEYEAIQRDLRSLQLAEDRGNELERLAMFLDSVMVAWDEASQKQRNKLSRTLFDGIRIEDTKSWR